jgi:hypothetical protein
MTFALGGNFQLQPELLVVTKGATDQITIGPTTVDETLIFDYFEIPMLMRIPFASGASVRPSLLVGPALAIKLKSRVEFGAPLDGSVRIWTTSRIPISVWYSASAPTSVAARVASCSTPDTRWASPTSGPR